MEQQNKPNYQDTTLSFEDRAQDLVSHMTLMEKVSQLRYDAPAISHLEIPAYNWWGEALHGVARAGTATVFPQAIGLAAIFDDIFLFRVADVISTEGRAKYNMYSAQEDRGIYKGLTFWSPNINIFRDPRWGRGQETYGEDPYLTSRLGVAFVKGLQQRDSRGYLKAAACAKHFAVHSGPEELRHEFNAIVNQKDLWETYLPAFEALVKEADVEAVMGAYNRTNNEPCCGSKTLLKNILRDKWAFRGHVVSDCWAICDFNEHHRVTSTPIESAALALRNGCDLNCGRAYQNIMLAYDTGLITEEEITQSTIRLMTTRLKLGMFDKSCSYHTIPYSKVECPEHIALCEEAAVKSMVLLKNDGLLPLDKTTLHRVAVIGPTADSREILKGNYCGTSSQYSTILEGIREALPTDARIFYSEGCHLFKDQVEPLAKLGDRLAEAKAAAEASQVVFLCLGLDATMEGEEGDTGNEYASGDKPDISLPASQKKLLQAVLSVGKPTVLLLSTGSAMDLQEADANCNAILETWYCGACGGRAVAKILLGEEVPSGKLPVTFYRNSDELPDFCDYSMKGRTYRYLETEPLYPFGFGLSYATIFYDSLSADKETVKDGENVTVSFTMINRSSFACEEVAEVYLEIDGSLLDIPHWSLCGFRRVLLRAGEEKCISLTINKRAFQVVNFDGESIYDGKSYKLFVGGSQPDPISVARMGSAPLCIRLARKCTEETEVIER